MPGRFSLFKASHERATMKATKFNGLMMRIMHNGRTLFLQRNDGAFNVIQTTPVDGGLCDTYAATGNLNDPRNLETFINYVAEKLGI